MNESNGKRAIISRETLVPLALVFVVGSVMFGVGVAWTSQGHRIDSNTDDIAGHESRLKLAEARIELWRRLVEVRLQMELPEPADNASLTEPAGQSGDRAAVAVLGALGSPPPGSEPGG